MHFDECVCSSLCNLVCWTVDCHCGLFFAIVTVPEVVVVIWVPVITQVVVPEVVAMAVVDCDMAVVTGGSGCEQRGWGLGLGAVN
jgi:hypothetical protein